ncbi:MAG: cyanophycin synthetase [Clostridia bacterium]|nr:cyanophycin synthetase [Clostridia bacterium]
MQIYSIQSLAGKNIYSHKSVIKMVLNIGDLHDKTSKDIEGFNETLISYFPGIKKHYCSLGYEGGFVERLKEGTYMGHITEHLILELQTMMGYEVCYGKTRIITEPSLYYLIYEFKNERCAIECGKAGVEIISSIARGKSIDIQAIIDNLKKVTVESELGPSTKAIFDEAVKRGIPITRVGSESLLQLGYGKYSRLIESSLTDATSCISADIAGNKHLTKQILMDNNIPVPYGDIAYTEESAVLLAKDIGYPLVVKPFDGNQGKGVALNIRDEAQVRSAYKEAIKYSKAVVIERYIKGKDYRILVVGNKVSAVSERRPPSVTGDGVHTIKELVEIENSKSLRGDDHEKPLTKIKLDTVAKQILERNNIDEDYVPAADEVVNLRENGNISTGGTARDCTAEIHPYNAVVAVKAAKAIGLDVAGIDMTIGDISIPLGDTNGAIVEVNAAPGLRMHLYPTEGEANNVAADIMDMMFPESKPHSIPIVSITGTNGKTTTTRLIGHTLALAGLKVGMTSTSGVYIGDECIIKGDNTGPVSAKMVLSNKEVEAAVLETARGGIVRKGLGYNLADVGVIVNISDDHLGLDGVNSLQDLAFVKALVIEAVKPDGYAVLNADDEMTDYLLKRVVSKVIVFSREASNPLVLEQLAAGGRAVYIDGETIFLQDGEERTAVIDIRDIPITFDGVVDCNIENSLAATSALFALDIPVETVRLGLKSFKPDITTNPGRFNLFDMGDFKVMLDYSHNTAGYNAVMNSVQRMEATRLVGVIGMPGDRLDRNIKEVGEVCAKTFSKIYVKEDNDLRGREPGEVAQILFEAIIKGGFRKENIEIIYSELKALESAMLDAQPGDLIVMFYEDFDSAVELVNTFRQELEQNVIQEEDIVQENAG